MTIHSIIGRSLASMLVVFSTGCALERPLSKEEYAPAQPVMPEARSEVDGAIYHPSNNQFLFGDIKARRVGDLLTVILQEQTDAAKTASTKAAKSSSNGIPAPTILGGAVTAFGRDVFQTSIDSSNDFSGSGDSSQSNSLSGNITVTVSEVLPNGNLVIRGEKLLTLNQGSEVISIAGIVRATDVTPENTVVSSQIADARITYAGDGIVADSNNAGWLTRFFQHPLWPF